MNYILEQMNPEDRTVIQTLVDKQGFKPDTPVEDVIKTLVTVEKTQEEGIALLSFIGISNNTSKYAPKLSFTQRCEILALHRNGVSRETIAKIYKVDRRTITHIYNSQSVHYRNVREEELRLGRNNFVTKYLTTDVQNAAFAFMGDKTDKLINNKAANRKAGIHTMRNEFCNYDHRVIIKWMEEDPEKGIKVAGWYYQDMEGEWPNDWFNCGPDSLKTSQSCYTHAMEDISDKLGT